ncbi:MAG: response regulator [bacterium]
MHKEEDQKATGEKTELGVSLRKMQKEVYEQPYGNLAALNTCRLLLDSVGEDLLFTIVSYFIEFLNTSVAIYEKNGDYALGIYSSGWCRLLDHASRNLCKTDDNAEALKSGLWHCHESCWNASKLSIERNRPVEAECLGGMCLFAVPIHARGEVIGSINFGCGNPPKARAKVKKIAERYGISADSLIEQGCASNRQSSLTVNTAKQRLLISARLIGEIVEYRMLETALRESKIKCREVAAGIPGIVFHLMLKKDGSLSLPFASEAFYQISGLRAGEFNPSGLLDLIVPEDLDHVIKTITRSAQILDTCKAEFRINTKAGEVIWLHAVAYPHLLSDGSVLWNGVALNTDEQKQATGTGNAAAGLRRGPVHDFNNILAILMGYTELTLDSTSEENPARPYLLEMLKAIHHAKSLLRQIHTCNSLDEERKERMRQGPVQQKQRLSTLELKKPVQQELVQPESKISESFPRGEGSILLVDDEESIVYVGQQILAHLGYEVFPRTSSLEALDTFREEPKKFDLVILDQVMPNMSGTELARELIAIRPDIPIILCTGFNEEATPIRVKALGIRKLIMKPLDMYQVAEVVRNVLIESGMRRQHG